MGNGAYFKLHPTQKTLVIAVAKTYYPRVDAIKKTEESGILNTLALKSTSLLKNDILNEAILNYEANLAEVNLIRNTFDNHVKREFRTSVWKMMYGTPEEKIELKKSPFWAKIEDEYFAWLYALADELGLLTY